MSQTVSRSHQANAAGLPLGFFGNCNQWFLEKNHLLDEQHEPRASQAAFAGENCRRASARFVRPRGVSFSIIRFDCRFSVSKIIRAGEMIKVKLLPYRQPWMNLSYFELHQWAVPLDWIQCRLLCHTVTSLGDNPVMSVKCHRDDIILVSDMSRCMC